MNYTYKSNLDQFFLTKLWFTIFTIRIQDDTVFPVSQSCDLDNAQNFLIDIWNECFCIVHADQPFFTILPDLVQIICERSCSTNMDGFLK